MTWLRPLGNTGIQVSALGLGTVKLGRNTGVRYPAGFQLPDKRRARELLANAQQLGINLLDTAPAYGDSETRLGELLQGQRDAWVICSKVGEEFEAGQSRHDFSPQHIRYSVERSLRRLRTDFIDVLLLHSNGEDVDILQNSGSLEMLRELARAGLVRAVGISSKTITGGVMAARLCDVVMLTYNLADTGQAAVMARCAQEHCGVLIKKPLDSGHLPVGREAAFLRDSMTLVLGNPNTGSAVVGTISPAHLADNVAAARVVTG